MLVKVTDLFNALIRARSSYSLNLLLDVCCMRVQSMFSGDGGGSVSYKTIGISYNPLMR